MSLEFQAAERLITKLRMRDSVNVVLWVSGLIPLVVSLFFLIPLPVLAAGNIFDSLDSVVNMSEKELLEKYGDQLVVEEEADASKVSKIWRLKPEMTDLQLSRSLTVHILTSLEDKKVNRVFLIYLPASSSPGDYKGAANCIVKGISNSAQDMLSDGFHDTATRLNRQKLSTLVKGDTDAQRWKLVKGNITKLSGLSKSGIRAIFGDGANCSGSIWSYQITPVRRSADGKKCFGDDLEFIFGGGGVFSVTISHSECNSAH